MLTKLFDYIKNLRAEFSLENPSFSLSDPRITQILGNRQGTSSGILINEETSLGLSTVFACVKVISETMGELPFRVMQREGDSIAENMQHPLYFTLLKEPSPLYNSFDFIQTLVVHALTWGNGYARIARNRFGQPIQFEIIEPWNVKPKRLDTGEIFYETINADGTQKDNVRAINMIHIKNLGTNGLIGKSPIRLQRESIGNMMAQDRFEGDFYKNGASAEGVLMTPGRISPNASKNLTESFAENQGLGNKHKTILLEDGVRYQQLTIPQSDAQFIETRKFHRSEIAGWFRVPPPLVGDLEHATFANIMELNRGFAKYTISPWASRIQQEFDRKVFSDQEKMTTFTSFDLAQITRGDAKTEAEIAKIEIESGVKTINERRQEKGKKDIPNGDEPLINGAYVPLSKLGTDE